MASFKKIWKLYLDSYSKKYYLNVIAAGGFVLLYPYLFLTMPNTIIAKIIVCVLASLLFIELTAFFTQHQKMKEALKK